jgi:predicted enzyme involved in methoxymalonyl-ACP biosynthesis
VCLASKNAEQDVLDVFEKRPELALYRAYRRAPHQLEI